MIRISDKDRQRWQEMAAHEAGLHERGVIRVAGIDEAGRGPLAGPVVAAAVVLCKEPIYGLNDSKKLTEKRRAWLYDEILDKCEVAIAQVGPLDIDHMNILNATKMAMRMALLSLEPVNMALFDAVRIDNISCAQEGLVKGDMKVNAIAAASIVAKVTRDRLMCLYDLDYPAYGFARHKGYATREHMAIIRRLGPTPIHRQSFLRWLQDA